LFDINVFGGPIFKGYYSIHDTKNSKIGFAPLKKSPKQRLQIGEVPLTSFEAPLEVEMSIWVYLVTALFIVFLAAVHYFVLIPELSKCISSQILRVSISTVSVWLAAAAYVFGLLPLIKKAFNESIEAQQ
jgi:hypothetical protein